MRSPDAHELVISFPNTIDALKETPANLYNSNSARNVFSPSDANVDYLDLMIAQDDEILSRQQTSNISINNQS